MSEPENSAVNLGGRPTVYTREIADSVCEKLAEIGNLRAVCRLPDMPPESTVRLWAVQDVDGFGERYRDAREIGYHTLADEVLDIADNGRNDWMGRENDGGEAINHEAIARSRLRFDARRWLLSKALPKIYGDKQEVDHKSSDGSMTPTRVEIVALQSKPNDDSKD